MWIVAGLHMAGTEVETAARVVGAVSHLATVVIVYLTTRALSRGTRVAALLSVTYVAIGPAKGYIAAGFGTPLFALTVAIVWCAALMLARRPTSARAVAFSTSCVLMGIARPEGALIAMFAVIGLGLYWRENGQALRHILPLVSCV
jgi:hypothetical protein